MSKTFDFSDYEKSETETKTGYNPFTTTSTTTQQPTIEREKDVVSKDSELYDNQEVGIPKNNTADDKHPVSTADEDIDSKPHGNNTIPYQQVISLIHLIERTGIPTIWERAFPCPCFDPDTQQPRADCPLCYGKGLLYKSPKVLQVAFQGNSKNPYNGQFGNEDIGTTKASPALTENGIENGISFRDRLTIMGLTIAQTFMYNVNKFRENNGMFIPYLINKFNDVYSLVDKDLVNLSEHENKEFTEDNQFYFDSKTNRMYVSPNLNGHNITMSITSPLRYYVVDIAKETRYAQVKKQQDKEAVLNYGDEKLTNYVTKYKSSMDNGTIYIRLPKLLILRREDMYIPKADIVDDNNKVIEDKTTVVDPKATIPDESSLSSYFGN